MREEFPRGVRVVPIDLSTRRRFALAARRKWLEPVTRVFGSMAEKTRRRLMLEQSLADDPADSFLRYGLAIQCLREGDVQEGRERLLALIADHPEDQVAAYQQLAQSYSDSQEPLSAVAVLRTGIAKANAARDWHAAAEMQQMLDSLD